MSVLSGNNVVAPSLSCYLNCVNGLNVKHMSQYQKAGWLLIPWFALQYKNVCHVIHTTTVHMLLKHTTLDSYSLNRNTTNGTSLMLVSQRLRRVFK
jgi:hypothetical protein